ncbi:MAG: cytochrome b5-like heme/steroid binding domain-containing protein [Candidatus Paceibacterota bacterium]|jgi:cytochrome b involved in lipid metabolism
MNKKTLFFGAVIIIILIGIYLVFRTGDIPTDSALDTNNQNSSSTEQSVTQQSDIQESEYTLAIVSSHNTNQNCWMVIDNKVYDVTSYIASGQHNKDISKGCGIDATSMFDKERKHQDNKAQNLLSGLEIGTLKIN